MYMEDCDPPVTPGGEASHHGESAGPARKPGVVIVALTSSRVMQARVTTLAGRRGNAVFVSTVERLAIEARRWRRDAVLSAEARDAQPAPVPPLLREISDRCPDVALIGFCTRHTPSSDILALANAGIDVLIQEGIDDEGFALRAAYKGSIEARAARRILAAIKDVVPS